MIVVLRCRFYNRRGDPFERLITFRVKEDRNVKLAKQQAEQYAHYDLGLDVLKCEGFVSDEAFHATLNTRVDYDISQ